jgi:hypothetical protein
MIGQGTKTTRRHEPFSGYSRLFKRRGFSRNLADGDDRNFAIYIERQSGRFDSADPEHGTACERPWRQPDSLWRSRLPETDGASSLSVNHREVD